MTENTAVGAALVSYCNHSKCMWQHRSLWLDSFSNVVCQLKLKCVSLMLFLGAKKNNWIRKTRKANQDAWIIYIGLLLTGGRTVCCLEMANTVLLSKNLTRKNACKSSIIYGNRYLYSDSLFAFRCRRWTSVVEEPSKLIHFILLSVQFVQMLQMFNWIAHIWRLRSSLENQRGVITSSRVEKISLGICLQQKIKV